MTDTITLSSDLSTTNKSFLALYAAVQGDASIVSGSLPSNVSFKEDIIEDGSYTGENNTIGTDETVFSQFAAYVSGSVLWNGGTDSTAILWTHSLANGHAYHYHYLSMSMFVPDPSETRWHSHLNRPEWFTFEQAPPFYFTSGSHYAVTLPYLTPSSSINMHTYRSLLLGGTTNDVGILKGFWSDPYNYFNDAPDCGGGGPTVDCYSMEDGRIVQNTIFTVYSAGGSGGGG